MHHLARFDDFRLRIDDSNTRLSIINPQSEIINFEEGPLAPVGVRFSGNPLFPLSVPTLSLPYRRVPPHREHRRCSIPSRLGRGSKPTRQLWSFFSLKVWMEKRSGYSHGFAARQARFHSGFAAG
jgi:hypothetical protein